MHTCREPTACSATGGCKPWTRGGDLGKRNTRTNGTRRLHGYYECYAVCDDPQCNESRSAFVRITRVGARGVAIAVLGVQSRLVQRVPNTLHGQMQPCIWICYVLDLLRDGMAHTWRRRRALICTSPPGCTPGPICPICCCRACPCRAPGRSSTGSRTGFWPGEIQEVPTVGKVEAYFRMGLALDWARSWVMIKVRVSGETLASPGVEGRVNAEQVGNTEGVASS